MACRLLVYLLIDTSNLMKGEPIEPIKVGIEAMLTTLCNDPYDLETVNISIIIYDREVNQSLPLTPIDELQVPEITTPDNGPTHMGTTLEMLIEKVDKEVNKDTQNPKEDWMPLLLLINNGKPSNNQYYNNLVLKIKCNKFATIVYCATVPKAKTDELHQLTDKVYQIDTLDSSTHMKFFKWVSDIIGEGNKPMRATDELVLPPPPEEIKIVI